MFRGDEAVAVTSGVVVWFDYAKNQALPLPDPVRARIRSFEPVKPEE
jgi:acyl-CoA thioesterase FadM